MRRKRSRYRETRTRIHKQRKCETRNYCPQWAGRRRPRGAPGAHMAAAVKNAMTIEAEAAMAAAESSSTKPASSLLPAAASLEESALMCTLLAMRISSSDRRAYGEDNNDDCISIPGHARGIKRHTEQNMWNEWWCTHRTRNSRTDKRRNVFELSRICTWRNIDNSWNIFML